MGGYFSTRWGSERTRQHTDPLLFLNIAYLRKIGALEPGAWKLVSWTRRGEPAGDITTRMSKDGWSITLDYRIRTTGEDAWRPIREEIFLEHTPCNYGGERPWFSCPGCRKRRGVLYSVNGRFRCRQCHDLAYSSTREDTLDRSIRHADRLRKRIGDTSRGPIYRWPKGDKPKGMHWETYARLREQLYSEIMRTEELFIEGLGNLLELSEKLEKKSGRK
jgi:hypothetical protein